MLIILFMFFILASFSMFGRQSPEPQVKLAIANQKLKPIEQFMAFWGSFKLKHISITNIRIVYAELQNILIYALDE